MEVSHMGLKLRCCNNEVAALQGNHYFEIPLHVYIILYRSTRSRNYYCIIVDLLVNK